jgi:spermidine/putrescine-binding protein
MPMRNLSKRWLAVPFTAAALSLGAGAPAQAQQGGSGLVVVNVQDVIDDIALDLNVDVSQIPVTVQAPIGVAANVCDVNANVLAAQRRDGGAECDAEST